MTSTHELKELYYIYEQVPVSPFDFETSDDNDENDDNNGGSASGNVSHTDTKKEDTTIGASLAPSVITIDHLVAKHSMWLKTTKELRPDYKQCIEVMKHLKATEEKLRGHLEKKPNQPARSKRWSMFDDISQTNDSILFENRNTQ